jgi:hypothetical protein
MLKLYQIFLFEKKLNIASSLKVKALLKDVIFFYHISSFCQHLTSTFLFAATSL